MKYQALPDWTRNLQADPRLAEIGFNIFNEDQFKQANPKGKALYTFGEKKKTLYLVGCSNFFGRTQYIGLCLDPERPQEIRVALNGADSPIFLYCNPEIEILRDVYKCYIEKALAIPKENVLQSVARLRKEKEPQTLSDPNRKEILFSYGYGDWDDMVALENEMLTNRFLSPYVVNQATGPADGDTSQYFTAFSASLCSIIRLETLGTTLYFLSFQYVPTDLPYTKRLKAEYANSPIVQSFPDDSPLDLIGMWHETNNLGLRDAETLFQLAQQGDQQSILVLSVMTEFTGEFEKYFMPLALNPEIEIRDLVAKKALENENSTVLAKVLEGGVSPGVREEALAQYPSLFQE